MSQDSLDFDAMQDAMAPIEDEGMLLCEWHGGMALSNHGLAALSALLPVLLEAGDTEDQEVYQDLATDVNEDYTLLTTYIRETDPQDLDLELLTEYTNNLLYTVQIVVGLLIQEWMRHCPHDPLPSPPLTQTPFNLSFLGDDN